MIDPKIVQWFDEEDNEITVNDNGKNKTVEIKIVRDIDNQIDTHGNSSKNASLDLDTDE